jgi:hypothetical protein
MKLALTLSSLAAVLLAACSATAPAQAPANADAAAAADEQSRVIRGSLINPEPSCTTTPPPNANTNVAAWLACDSQLADRTGFNAALMVDSNRATNPNNNKDHHLQVAVNGFAPGVTATMITVASGNVAGDVWDSFGPPNHAVVTVYAADNTTQIWKAGDANQAVPLAGHVVFNLYFDGLNNFTGTELKSGDPLTITFKTNVGDSVWPNVTL